MDRKHLLIVLIELGLTDKEGQVYLALLSLGPATILQIARRAELKRTTVYSLIETLKHRGLVGTEVHGFKNLIVPEDPAKLQSLFDLRREALKNALPEFESLYRLKSGESFIKYYEGLAGVKSVYENVLADLQKDDRYLVISDQTQWLDLDRSYFTDFIERRAEIARTLHVDIRILFQDSSVAREHKKYEKNYFEAIRFLPPETSLTTNLIITPRQVVIHQLIPPVMATVIQSRSIIQMHREQFDIIWSSCGDSK